MSRKVHIVFRLLNFLHSTECHKYKLNDLDHRVLINLASHHGKKGIFPKQKTIALELKKGHSTIRRSLDKLESLGLIKRSYKHRAHSYELWLENVTVLTDEHSEHDEDELTVLTPEQPECSNLSSESAHERAVSSIYIINTKKNSIKNPRKKGENADDIVVLPDWLASQDWESFKSHRKEIKSPMSVRAQKLMIQCLVKLHADGQNPEECINQSIMNGWKGIFSVRKLNNVNGQVKKESYRDKVKAAVEKRIQHPAGSSSIFEVRGNMAGSMDSKH